MAEPSTPGLGADTVKLPRRPVAFGLEAEAASPDPVEIPAAERLSAAEAIAAAPTHPPPEPSLASQVLWVSLSAPGLSAIWLVGCFWYFQYVLGWEALFGLLPHEFAGFFAGSMAPLALLWLIVAYRRHDAALQHSIQALDRRLSALTYPDEDAESRVEKITEALRRQAEMLTRASDHALANTQQVESDLDRHCQDLGLVAEQAAAQAQFVSETLHQQCDRLAATSEQIIQQSNDLSNALSRQTGELDQALTRAVEQAPALGAIIAAAAKQANQLDGSVRELGRSLEASAAKAAVSAGEISQAIERQSAGLNETADSVAKVTEDMGDTLRRRLDELLGASDQARDRIGAVGDAYRQQAQQLTEAADQAAGRIEHAAGELERAVRHSDPETSPPLAEPGLPEPIPTPIRRPPAGLEDAADGASESAAARLYGRRWPEPGEPAEDAAPASDATRREAFLRAASFVVDKLNSMAIDLNRALEREIPRGIWRIFYGGDKSAYTRRILSVRNLRDLKRIRHRYHHDAAFRQHVSNYIAAFEGLLEQVGKQDHEYLLRTTFLTADVGKLYLLLSRAVDRTGRS